MDFRTLLKTKEFVILDGAMGTMLQAKGLEMGGTPEALNIDKPDWLVDIHRQYINAGSDIVYANTFGANRHKLEKCGYTVQQAIPAAIKNARKACEGTDTLVALDIGPIGQLLEPTGTLTFEEAYDIYKEQIEALVDAGVDFLAVETMMSLQESRAALIAAKETCPDIPVMVTMTFESDGRSLFGTDAATAAIVLSSLGADAVGANCSTGPDQMAEVIRRMAKVTGTKMFRISLAKAMIRVFMNTCRPSGRLKMNS